MATLTDAQRTALRLLAKKPEGHYAAVSNHFELGMVGYPTARALDHLGLARVVPDRTGYWVEITDKGLALLAEVSELHSSTNATEA